jgi:hypothetical protein
MEYNLWQMNSDRLFATLSFYMPWALVIGAIVMIASDVIAIGLNGQYSPIHETISELVHYQPGWIITIGIAAVAIMHMLLAVIALSSPAARCHRLIRSAGILFAIMGVGFIIVMIFNTDLGEGIITLTGGIHVVTDATISILFPIACALLTIALWRHRKSENLILFTAIIAAASLFIAWQVMPQNDIDNLGAYERLLAFVNLSWIVAAGFRLPRLLGIC